MPNDYITKFNELDKTMTTEEIVNEENITSIVTKQIQLVESLSELEIKSSNSRKKAESAKNAAESASNKKTGLFGKTKRAVEALQESNNATNEAIISMVKMQDLIITFQRKLAELSEYWIKLGTFNIALNRSIINELEQHLAGNGSEGKLSESTHKRISAIMRDLKSKEDERSRREKLEKIVRQHDDKIDELSSRIDSVGKDRKKPSFKAALIKICFGVLAFFVLGIIGMYQLNHYAAQSTASEKTEISTIVSEPLNSVAEPSNNEPEASPMQTSNVDAEEVPEKPTVNPENILAPELVIEPTVILTLAPTETVTATVEDPIEPVTQMQSPSISPEPPVVSDITIKWIPVCHKIII